MIGYILAAMALYIGANGYIYWRMLQALAPLPQGVCIAFTVLFWFCAIALFIALATRDLSLPHPIHRTLFLIGSVWLVFLLYMVLITAIFDVAHLIFPALQGGVWYALVATIILMIYGYVNYRQPHIEHLTIECDRPIEGDGYRLVAISDVHLGYGTSRDNFARYVNIINEQKPDVVLIVGDLIDNSLRPVIYEDMAREAERIIAPDGIYMVAGNHEYISDIDACEEYLATTPIRLIRDSVVTLPCGVQLICRDDRTNRHRAPLDTLIAMAAGCGPRVVLDHQPNDIPTSARLGVDIHISGHTHHGQVWPISLITDMLFEQSCGYRKWGKTHAVVSSGLSLWGPPFRIGTNSDVVVVDIR